MKKLTGKFNTCRHTLNRVLITFVVRTEADFCQSLGVAERFVFVELWYIDYTRGYTRGGVKYKKLISSIVSSVL